MTSDTYHEHIYVLIYVLILCITIIAIKKEKHSNLLNTTYWTYFV